MTKKKLRALIRAPFIAKFENTLGCNIRCKFCVVHSNKDLQAKEKREFASTDLAKVFASGIGEMNPNVRIEMAGRGEPTLNPSLTDNIAIIRKIIPRAQIVLFTNGMVLLKDKKLAREVFDAGCNFLNIDCYNGTYDRFSEVAKEIVSLDSSINISDYRVLPSHRRYAKGHEFKLVNLIPDIQDDARLVHSRTIHNQAGNLAEYQLNMFGMKRLETPLRKMCKIPFTDCNVLVDGSINICCHDWGEECVLGKIPNDTIEDVWYSKHHLDILRSLHRRDRSGIPCNSCDYFGGARVGLVRNPFTGSDPWIRS